MSMCSEGASNPDVAGIGVRAAFYAQSLLSILISFWNPETLSGDYLRTSRVTAVCLVISAAVQYSTSQSLSLIDGVLVSMLAVMLDNSVIMDLNKMIVYARERSGTIFASRRLAIMSMGFDPVLATITSASTTAWGIFAWVRIKRCSSEAVFVLFGHNIPLATQGIQRFALLFFAIKAYYTLTMILTIVLGLTIILFKPKQWIQSPDEEDAQTTSGIDAENATVSSEADDSALNERQRTALVWLLDVFADVIRVVSLVVYLLTWAAVVSSIEQIIQRNGLQEDLFAWTFGQALAVSMVLLNVMKAVSALKNRWWPTSEWEEYTKVAQT